MKIKEKTYFIATTAMLSGIAFVLMYLEIVVPFMPAFIKFDFSDLPALLGAFAYGPVCGVIICLIKNLLHMPFSNSFFVGELANFLLGAIFVVPAGIIYKKHKNKKNAIVGAIIGSVCMAVASIFTNYFITYPVYYTFLPEEAVLSAYQMICPKMKSVLQCLLVFNLPFTLVKGLIATGISILIYKPLSPLLKGKSRK